MLVLSRKPGQRILIGDRIELEVLAIRRGQVRLGITCPEDLRVLRTELLAPRLTTGEGKAAGQPLSSHARRQRDLIDTRES